MQHRKSYKNIDLTGQRFGRLQVISKNPNGRSTFICQCDCGNQVIVSASRLLDRTISCGCALKDAQKKFAQNLVKHGGSYTKLYYIYRGMLDRCYNSKNRNYYRYGARGITVCDEWKNSFINFREWAYQNGYDETLDKKNQTIDRIDNNGDYCPENCRWATAKQQQENRNITTFYDFRGEKMTASHFADIHGIKDKSFVYGRLKRGRNLEQILFEFNCSKKLPEHLVECSEVAEQLGLCKTSVTRLIKQGKLKGEKIGRKWYVVK
jgi:excisionase family DNA binding protein